jgi:hypothetical protein
MPRYFFNVINDVKAEDFNGIELPDLDAARGEAQKDIDEIKELHFSSIGNDWTAWSIEICDSDGALLLVVPFKSS